MFAQPGFGIPGGHSFDAFIDPVFTIDQRFSDRYQIITSSGVGNAFAVPEPTTWALMITGFGAAGAMLRRRRQTLAA